MAIMKKRIAFWLLLVLSSVGVAYLSVQFLFTHLGEQKIVVQQYENFNGYFLGTRGTPEQYRWLSYYLVGELVGVLDSDKNSYNVGTYLTRDKGTDGFDGRNLHVVLTPFSWPMASSIFRLFQDTIILLLFGVYFSKITKLSPFIGVTLLGWLLPFTSLSSGISFTSHTEVAIYLAFAIMLWRCENENGGSLLVIPLTLLGILNRETCVGIPLIAIVWSWFRNRSFLPESVVACIVYAVGFIAPRLIWPQDFYTPTLDGVAYGIGTFTRNVSWRSGQLSKLFAFTMLVPVLAYWRFKSWDFLTKLWGVLLVPAWVVIHLWLGTVGETKLFLVPMVLVFLPGFMSAIKGETTNGSV